MKLIVNADDLGLTLGINQAILEAYQKGIVRSATIMVNMPAASDAAELFNQFCDFGIGLHGTLDAGKPVLKCHKRIVDKNGHFKDAKAIIESGAYDEIKRELQAQMIKAKELGLDITHLDSHHHIHLFSMKIFEIFNDLAKQEKIPLRLGKQYKSEALEDNYIQLKNANSYRTTDILDMTFFDKSISTECLKGILDRHKEEGVVEIMVHPGYDTADLKSSYKKQRERELEILTDPEIMTFISDNKIELVNYRVV